MYEKTLVNATLKRLIETSAGINTDNLYSEPDEPRQVIDTEIIPQDEPQEQQEIIPQGEPTTIQKLKI